ncbi:uncharacterized protein LOC144904135 [Branchiostoma floridae x Branchiostoma belcheri]
MESPPIRLPDTTRISMPRGRFDHWVDVHSTWVTPAALSAESTSTRPGTRTITRANSDWMITLFKTSPQSQPVFTDCSSKVNVISRFNSDGNFLNLDRNVSYTDLLSSAMKNPDVKVAAVNVAKMKNNSPSKENDKPSLSTDTTEDRRTRHMIEKAVECNMDDFMQPLAKNEKATSTGSLHKFGNMSPLVTRPKACACQPSLKEDGVKREAAIPNQEPPVTNASVGISNINTRHDKAVGMESESVNEFPSSSEEKDLHAHRKDEELPSREVMKEFRSKRQTSDVSEYDKAYESLLGGQTSQTKERRISHGQQTEPEADRLDRGPSRGSMRSFRTRLSTDTSLDLEDPFDVSNAHSPTMKEIREDTDRKFERWMKKSSKRDSGKSGRSSSRNTSTSSGKSSRHASASSAIGTLPDERCERVKDNLVKTISEGVHHLKSGGDKMLTERNEKVHDLIEKAMSSSSSTKVKDKSKVSPVNKSPVGDKTESTESKISHLFPKVVVGQNLEVPNESQDLRRKSIVEDVVFDETGMTWGIYGAELDAETLGDAIQKHLELRIKQLQNQSKERAMSIDMERKQSRSEKPPRWLCPLCRFLCLKSKET